MPMISERRVQPYVRRIRLDATAGREKNLAGDGFPFSPLVSASCSCSCRRVT